MGHEAPKKNHQPTTYEFMTCAYINSTDRHTHSQLRGPAVDRQASQAPKGKGRQRDGWMLDKNYVSLPSARAPVSYQFRMREPWYKLPSPWGEGRPSTTARRRRRRRLNLLALDLALPSLPVSKYAGPETGGTVGALAKGGTALPLQRAASPPQPSPDPLLEPLASIARLDPPRPISSDGKLW